MEGPEDGHIQPSPAFIKQEEEEENLPQRPLQRKVQKLQREEKEGRNPGSGSSRKPQKAAEKKSRLPELSKKQLLHLLGVMEGEVQVCPCSVPKSCYHVVLVLHPEEGGRPEHSLFRSLTQM